MKIDTVIITDYGPCYPKGVVERVVSEHSPTGRFIYADGIAFVKTTDTIDLRKGVNFGISYQLEANNDGKEPLRFVCRILHPELTNPTTGESFSETVEHKEGWASTAEFDFYTFEFDWEMVPGEWVFQIVQEERTLAQQVFRVF